VIDHLVNGTLFGVFARLLEVGPAAGFALTLPHASPAAAKAVHVSSYYVADIR
jgi:hypothetical protein